MNVKKTALCATLILISAISGAAVASTSVDTPASVKVKFGDLDLNSSDDVSTLYKRIRRASFQVCVIPQDGRDMLATRQARQCRQASVNRAVHQVGVPALIEMHQKRI